MLRINGAYPESGSNSITTSEKVTDVAVTRCLMIHIQSVHMSYYVGESLARRDRDGTSSVPVPFGVEQGAKLFFDDQKI
jgi:hypothetical protein